MPDFQEIVWSKKAKKNYFSILDYLLSEWTEKEMLAFHKKTLKVLHQISRFPEMFVFSGKKDIRKCVLTKQVTLYYKVFPDKIILVTFWDSRKNPGKLKL
jgi:plasmid stabilization system protein ParE